MTPTPDTQPQHPHRLCDWCTEPATHYTALAADRDGRTWYDYACPVCAAHWSEVQWHPIARRPREWSRVGVPLLPLTRSYAVADLAQAAC